MNKKDIASYKMRVYSWFASITIVMLHTAAYFANGNEESINLKFSISENLIGFLHFIGTLSMAWFFFSSSYFFFRNYTRNTFLSLIVKRVKTLVIPYLLWNLIYIVYEILLNLRVGKVIINFMSVIKDFIFFYWPGIEMIAPANLPLWYIIRIFTYFLTAPIIYLLVKNKKLWLIAEIISVATIYICNANYYSYLYWLPAFLFGGGCAIHYREKLEEYIAGNHNHKNCNLLLLVIYVLICLLFFVFNVDVTFRRYMGLVIAFIMLHYMKVDIDKKIPKVGESSLLYFSHFIVINFWVRLFGIMNLDSNTVFTYVLYVFLTVLSVEVVGKVLRKWVKPIYTVFVGGR